MLTILYFLLAISILVIVHEYGHFWVARRCGVQVKRFSVGFGKPLWSFTDKHGTEFSIAPIPLGGYVSMLDEREAAVPDSLKSSAFNNKTPWQRIAIASAGPLANFLFAILAYWFIFVSGVTGLVPVLGSLDVDSPAAIAGLQSGDQIVAVGGKETRTWEDVNWQLIRFVGETTSISLTVKDPQGQQNERVIPVNDWLSESDIPNPLADLGFRVRQPEIPAVLGLLSENGAAMQAGLRVGDKIIAINEQPIADWFALVAIIQAHPEQSLSLEVMRESNVVHLILTPSAQRDELGEIRGFMGAAVQPVTYPEEWLSQRAVDPFSAVVLGVQKTWQTTEFTLVSLWKMLVGQLSVKHLSGPVSIAQVAGASASGGLESFVGFLALLSVSLGVLNLLPVPILDGGHIMFCVAEIIKGKPVSERVQNIALRLGMALLAGLMIVAFYNDISRL